MRDRQMNGETWREDLAHLHDCFLSAMTTACCFCLFATDVVDQGDTESHFWREREFAPHSYCHAEALCFRRGFCLHADEETARAYKPPAIWDFVKTDAWREEICQIHVGKGRLEFSAEMAEDIRRLRAAATAKPKR